MDNRLLRLIIVQPLRAIALLLLAIVQLLPTLRPTRPLQDLAYRQLVLFTVLLVQASVRRALHMQQLSKTLRRQSIRPPPPPTLQRVLSSHQRKYILRLCFQ